MYWKDTTLRMTLRSGMRVRSGRASVCLSMRPHRRDEYSGAPHWPVGCVSLTGQGAFEHAGTMRDEYADDVLGDAVDSTREGCGMFVWLLQM